MKNVNFGIDLGTTNSGIAKYDDGNIKLYKNPIGFKDTLPSVVASRNGRIQVGEKARERIIVNPNQVYSSFKRKMGTDEVFYNIDGNKDISPINLSAYVIKELTSFVQDEHVRTAVITIPASFDTMQSNATKNAGYEAGLEEVFLLQEPIAACLAYSNHQNFNLEKDEKWLVYDFGGGTFDIALVDVNDRELKTIDHKGNNFLGGVDIDNLLLEKIVCKKLEEKGLENLWTNLTEASNATYQKLYFELLFRVEEAKKELSVKEVSVIEVDNDDLDLFTEVEITREEFNQVISEKFEGSYKLLADLVNSNGLSFSDIDRIIMVGGSTYIPYIRSELAERTKIEVDTTIDPTTAVILGAAYFAGNKPSKLEEVEVEEQSSESEVKAEWLFTPFTKDEEELISVILPSDTNGYYRITRGDGAFDSGMKEYKGRITEFVPLLPKALNQFTVQVFDQNQQLITSNNNIGITCGLYNVSGQPLPNDICLELDASDGSTMLETIFKKNDILPLKKTVYKTTSKTILKNSNDKLIINVVEGNAGNIPGSNLTIGYIELNGKTFVMDLLRGMEIELKFEISESRDIHVSVYVSSLDLEVAETFTPHKRTVSVDKMLMDLKYTTDELEREIAREEADENFEYLVKLQEIQKSLEGLAVQIDLVKSDVATERKYHLEDEKRRILSSYDDLVKHKHLINEISEYNALKGNIEVRLESARDAEKKRFQKIMKVEKSVLESGNKHLIKSKSKELSKLLDDILVNNNEMAYHNFFYFKVQDENNYTDPRAFQKLVETGDQAIESGNSSALKAVNNQLYYLLRVKPTFDNEDDFEGNLGVK